MGAKFFYRNIDLVYFVNNKLINNNLINQKDRILFSFSGGQDSICFTFILNQLYSQLELDITFFWCHHLWQTDSFYLMQQIAKLSFLLQFSNCFPIPLNSISSELLGRKWRQKCSYRVSLFYNYSKICLAHTFNDKVENIFLNFIRGTGLIGLTPLRCTQFISKSNITNKKHISRPNYLTNSCFASHPNLQLRLCRKPITLSGYAKQSFVYPQLRFTPMGYSRKPLRGLPALLPLHGTRVFYERAAEGKPFVPVARFSNSMGGFKRAVIKAVSEAVIKRNSNRNNSSASRRNFFTPAGYGIGIRLTSQRSNSLTHNKSSICTADTISPANSTPLTPSGYRGKEVSVGVLSEFFTNRRFVKNFLPFAGYRASLKSNEPNLCILQSNSEKLKILTKKVIQKDFALPQSQWDVLGFAPKSYRSYKSKICTICSSWQGKKGLEQLLFQRDTQRITNLTNINLTNINPKFVQIGKPLSQKGVFCLATKIRPEIITGATSEYKAKLCRAFTFQPTSDSSIINSCHKKYFLEQRRPLLCFAPQIVDLVPFPRYAKQSNWYKYSICKIWLPLQGIQSKTSPKRGKQLLNSGKGCYIVRPLLSISRIEVNKICYFWKLPIYPDKSNQKVKFFRNRVRGQLLPTIKLFFNLNIENIFLQLAKIIETEDYCLTQIVNEFTKNTDIYHTKLGIYSKKK